MTFRHRGRKRSFPRRALLLLVIGLGVWAIDAYRDPTPNSRGGKLPPSFAPGTTTAPSSAGATAVVDAFRERRSGFFAEVDGTVDSILRDDTEGSRHQRFILRLDGGHTLLVSHNIDLAPRVPAERGERLQVRGKYEWNGRGGVLHWTHHDPKGHIPGGWIRVRGETFR